MIGASYFLHAFSTAVHDVELESKGYTIYHFFDSDFLHRVTFGFRDPVNHALIHASRSPDNEMHAAERLLLAALVGQRIGAPPEMRALPPHLHELQLAASRPHSERGADRDLDMTIDLLGIKGLLRDLNERFEAGDADDVMEELLAHGAAIFSGIEMLSGMWEARLGRLVALQIHKETPFDFDADVVQSDAFDVLSRYVGQVGEEDRPGGAVNGLRDAMALAMLAAAVTANAGSEKPGPIVRFYTETPRILNAWREKEELRSLLTYDAAGREPHERTETCGVLRDPYYYLIRALIPELGYPGRREELEDQFSVYEVGLQLKIAAEDLRRGGLNERELSCFPVGGRSLGEYMTEVTDVSSYSSAWRRLMRSVPPGLPPALLADLRRVISGEQRLSRALSESLRRHIDELSISTSRVKAFTDVYAHIADAVRRPSVPLRPTWGGFSDHFGLVRWGFFPTTSAEAALQRLVDSFEEWAYETSDANEPRIASSRSRFLVDVAHRLRNIGEAPGEGRESVEQDVALLGFLWVVMDFTSVETYADALIRGIRFHLAINSKADVDRVLAVSDEYGHYLVSVAGALENMAAAARIRVELRSTRRAPRAPGGGRHPSIDMALDLFDRLEPAKRHFPSPPDAIAVAQAYILFHVWQAMNGAAMALGRARLDESRRPELVEKSFDVSYAALTTCGEEALAYPILVNHCLYVAAVSGLGAQTPGLESDLAKRLIAYRSSAGQAWSYRFDDTLGYYYYAQAARELARFRRDAGIGVGILRRARADVEQAAQWYERIPEETSDDEVVSHRNLLYELEAELEAELGKAASDQLTDRRRA